MNSQFQQDDNLEIFSLLWLDNPINNSLITNDFQQKLQIAINDVKMFEDVDKCTQYIQNLSQNDRIILVVTGRLGKSILPKIHDLNQVINIYIFCMDQKANEEWIKIYKKIKSIFTKIDDLLHQIRNDQRKREQDRIEYPFVVNFYDSTIDNAESPIGPNGSFIQTHIIHHFLIQMEFNDTTQTKFISLCKTIYKNNNIQLKLIQEFEHTYSPNRSISWYTRNCFLKRLIDKALQTDNFSLLINCLFYIHDMKKQCQITKHSSIHCFYHCQLISYEEFECLRQYKGQYISIRTFLSANADYQETLSILKDYYVSNNVIKVLFEIYLPIQIEYENILNYAISFNYFSNRKEILFMFGTIFRIDSVSCDKNDFVIINLTLQNPSFLDNITIEYMNKNKTLLSLGHILFEFERFNDAEICYYRLMESLNDENEHLSRCYHALASLAGERGDCSKSLTWHRKALDIKKKILPESHPSFAFNYNNIGVIYHRKHEYEQALDFYQQALDIWTKQYGENHLHIATCYYNIGHIYVDIENNSSAMDYFQKSLTIRQNILPSHHKDIVDVLVHLRSIEKCVTNS